MSEKVDFGALENVCSKHWELELVVGVHLLGNCVKSWLGFDANLMMQVYLFLLHWWELH